MDIYEQEETQHVFTAVSASYHIMKAVKIMLLGVFVHPQTHGWLVGLVSPECLIKQRTMSV